MPISNLIALSLNGKGLLGAMNIEITQDELGILVIEYSGRIKYYGRRIAYYRSQLELLENVESMRNIRLKYNKRLETLLPKLVHHKERLALLSNLANK